MNPAELAAELDRVCRLLELATPPAMEESTAVLQTVVCELSAANLSIQPAEALKLRTGVRKARLLLESAARFHRRWQEIVCGTGGGYTAERSLEQLSGSGRIRLSC
ncbi:MAG TPA: hypothetical protein VHW24_15780 [Bryobacteraceae bacterium]|jgi:hypothetical protein|nr:hypothetical protein [Bryobacteraceae bacterium]